MNLSLETVSSNEMHLTWNLPAITNGVLASYFVHVETANGQIFGNWNTSQLQFVVRNLLAYTNYSIKVNSLINN